MQNTRWRIENRMLLPLLCLLMNFKLTVAWKEQYPIMSDCKTPMKRRSRNGSAFFHTFKRLYSIIMMWMSSCAMRIKGEHEQRLVHFRWKRMGQYNFFHSQNVKKSIALKVLRQCTNWCGTKSKTSGELLVSKIIHIGKRTIFLNTR
jgi:hypothetical protein